MPGPPGHGSIHVEGPGQEHPQGRQAEEWLLGLRRTGEGSGSEGDENVPKLNYGDGRTILLIMLKNHGVLHFKWVNFIHANYSSIKLFFKREGINLNIHLFMTQHSLNDYNVLGSGMQ